jgi:hypothetical protein
MSLNLANGLIFPVNDKKNGKASAGKYQAPPLIFFKY